MWLTKFGREYGQTPRRMGNTYFVAPSASYTISGPQGQRSYSASDDNDGLSPERALRTVTRAVALTVASAGDIIMLLPGTHTVTATVTPVAGSTIIGEQPAFGGRRWAKPTTILTIRGTSDELLNIAADDIEIGYLTLQGTATYSIVSFQTTGAIKGFYLHDYLIDMDYKSGISIDSHGIDFGNRAGGQGRSRIGSTIAVATAYLENGVHLSNGANGQALHLATCSVHAFNLRFHNSAGTWASPVVIATNTDETLIDSCVWTTGATMNVAVSGYVAGYAPDITDGVYIQNCRVGNVSTAFSSFHVNTVRICENYAYQSGSAVGTEGGGYRIGSVA